MNKLECTRFTECKRGYLLGMASVLVPHWGVEINSISIHEKNGERWVNLPARAVEINGETRYVPYVRFPEKDHYLEFLRRVREAVEIKMHESEVPSDPNQILANEEPPF